MQNRLSNHGFIEELRDHITSCVPTNPDWAEALAISTLSPFLEGVQFATRQGKLNLNTFFLCIAPSSLGNKTVPMKNIARDIVSKASEQLERKGIQKGLLLPNKFTVEALIKHFGTVSNTGIIISDEFTSTLKDASKDYLSTLMEFLSELYDGQAQSRTTMKGGWTKAESCHVSFISATTRYVYTLLRPELFIQGTGNRFLYILYENPEFKEYKPEDFFMPPSQADSMEMKNMELANALVEFREVLLSRKYAIGLTDKAGEVLINFRRQASTKAIELYKTSTPSDFEYSYLSRMQENCYKLAAIKACSDSFGSISRLREIIMLKEEHAQWAIDRIMKYYDYFRRMMQQWKDYQNIQTKNSKTSEAVKKLVLSKVKEYVIISQQRLLQETGLFKGNHFYSITQTLEDEGRIKKLTSLEISAIPLKDRSKYGIGNYKGQIPTVYKFIKD